MSITFRGLQERLRERLLAHIHAGELTGIQLARQTGFQQAHISNFLNRKRGLSLEAMDEILRTMRISLNDLITPVAPKRVPRLKSLTECAGFVTVPVINESNCAATRVPNLDVRDTIKIASTVVQRLRIDMATPRPHWDRFIAIRVKAADAEAMFPRLHRGAIVVVDRHHNSLNSAKSHDRNIYLVRLNHETYLRYVERLGDSLILRPLNPEHPLLCVPAVGGVDAISAILGRVCFVHLHV